MTVIRKRWGYRILCCYFDIYFKNCVSTSVISLKPVLKPQAICRIFWVIKYKDTNPNKNGYSLCLRLCRGSKIFAVLWTNLSTRYLFFPIKSCWRDLSCLTLKSLEAPWFTSKSSSLAWCARYFLLESKLAMSVLKVRTIPPMFSHLYKYYLRKRMF